MRAGQACPPLVGNKKAARASCASRFCLRHVSLLLFILGGFHPRATADCGARPRPAAAPIDHNW
ncbi:hypothetical protein EXY28_33680 [Burkholderia pseudomallei]|nr:hypothetical protein EXY28_33680 [Burkholderia pseudomallei]